MQTTVTHARNPLAGWDISVSAKAGDKETITGARILVNGFSQYDEIFDAPLNQWTQQLLQQGDFPEENEVLVEITNGNDDVIRTQDSWK
ncbi:MAG TPA: hypothetical protein VGG46_02310 [Terriglobales bacterium]|jgi:hypothetical protein